MESTNNEFNSTLVKLVPKAKLMNILECPVCTENLTGQIFICLGGHSICKTCKKKLVECPTCKAKWSEGRNFMLEEIIQSSVHACSFKGDGCEVIGNGEFIQKHIKGCRYRPTKCPYYNFNIGENLCTNTSLKLHDIREHLASLHRYKVHDTHTLTTSRLITSPAKNGGDGHITHTFGVLTFDTKCFLCTLLSSKEKRRFFFIVLLLGPKEEEGLYRAKIVLQPGKKEMRSWNIPVLSVFDRIVTSVKDQFIPSFTWIEIQKIMNVVGNENPIDVNLKCTIKKCE